ncbi:HlyD family type I secretion periplasmic adaptor subunit [Defluviimonas sp. WL0002]|uniref:Membrane fusion protein (MFP) family protein n=1 Tax=Albidovulum marisflavi TaxID=2984159 RepID=A0ABT2ZD46_9RHOB|nr:HlyD family type I secretion periplasmic adaptor subunit [Defluviimonas sp. WL0002]MCV2868666.1 HlyD family type I secretion periplasmic adaptor subunit [Defluviimonas sp. WL0002]
MLEYLSERWNSLALEARWHDLAADLQSRTEWSARLDPKQFEIALAGAIGLAALALFALAIWLWQRRVPRSFAGRAGLGRLTRGPRWIGYAAALLLALGIGGWAAVAPLASAAVAHGVVSPDGSRKTIQHLEGGIIHQIHVREGDDVEPGQALVTLENIQARARHDELLERYYYLLATEARLVAEQLGKSEIVFPEALITASDAKAQGAMTGQRDLLASRLSARAGRNDILAQRVRQLEEQNNGLREMIAARDAQLDFIVQEITATEQLLKGGLSTQTKLLALQRAREEIRAERAANRAQIAGNMEKIGETRIQILTLKEQETEQASEQLTEVRRALGEVRSELPSRRDVLERTVIRSQIAGTVMNVRVTTESGVLEPGQPILDIVPADTDLVIDAKLRPVDIDSVRPGMHARVLLTAYRQRSLPQIHGQLRSVSADRITEPRTGEAYFLAKVVVDPDELSVLPDVKLNPGMPADVMILTGDRTLFEYLARPLSESLWRSFREK